MGAKPGGLGRGWRGESSAFILGLQKQKEAAAGLDIRTTKWRHSTNLSGSRDRGQRQRGAKSRKRRPHACLTRDLGWRRCPGLEVCEPKGGHGRLPHSRQGQRTAEREQRAATRHGRTGRAGRAAGAAATSTVAAGRAAAAAVHRYA